MEKQFVTAVGEPAPDSTETKCPFTGGARKHATTGTWTNADW